MLKRENVSSSRCRFSIIELVMKAAATIATMIAARQIRTGRLEFTRTLPPSDRRSFDRLHIERGRRNWSLRRPEFIIQRTTFDIGGKKRLARTPDSARLCNLAERQVNPMLDLKPIRQPAAPDRQRHQRAAQPGRKAEARESATRRAPICGPFCPAPPPPRACRGTARAPRPGRNSRPPPRRSEKSRARREAASPSPRRCRPSRARASAPASCG